MSSFDNAQVTLKGSVLLAKALNGEKLVFTRVAMGDGEYSGEIGAAEDLVNIRKNLAITKLTRKENIAIIGAILKLGDVDEEFSWTELGVYAKGEDDVEVLYMYGNAGDKASYISKLGLDEKLIDINIVVGNASNVSAMIDSSLVFLTEEALTEHEEDEDAHPKLKVWVQNLFASGDWAKYDQVGESTDSETKTTVFGSLNGIKALINSFKAAFDTFRTTYTDIRGAKLDNLDTKITSRAPADTALSSATWTDTRAGLIDTINTSTKTNNTASSTGTLSQKLSYLISTLIGATNATGGTTTAGTAMAKLNATLGKLTNGGISGTLKSVQRGVVNQTLSSDEGNAIYIDVTISKVNMDKSFILVNHPGWASGTEKGYAFPCAYFVNDTTIRVYHSQWKSTGAHVFEQVNWQVVEFY